jgi:hypothetical protein
MLSDSFVFSEVVKMRAGATLFTLFFLTLTSSSVVAADKIKVEIVEATNTILMVPHTFPGTPEQINTHCNASVSGNTANGDCNTTVKPATDPTTGLMPTAQYSAKAILPDGSHAALVCYPWNKNCGLIEPMASQKSSSNCDTSGGGNMTCTSKNLGTYRAKRDKNDLIIYGPNGKRKYQITGAW